MTFYNWGSKIDVSIDTISETNPKGKYSKLKNTDIEAGDEADHDFYKFYDARYSLQAYLRTTSKMYTDVLIILCLLVAYIVSNTYDFFIVVKEIE
jgi:hypothetical protein